jgi:Replication-relaxation
MPPDALVVAHTHAKHKHRPRFRRAAVEERPAFRLTDRDRELLKIIFDYRFITASLLQDLAPAVDLTDRQQEALRKLREVIEAKKANGSSCASGERSQRTRREILRRLQMLYHHGYLQRKKLSDKEPIVYSLGNLGADELVLIHGYDRQEIDWTTKNRESTERYMQHGLLVSRFRHAFELALRNVPDASLETWYPGGTFKAKVTYENTVRTREGTRTQPVEKTIVPDALFVVKEGGKRIHYFLEADRSRMSNARFVEKLMAYYAFWATYSKAAGIAQMRVLTVTISEVRKDNLREAADTISDEAKGLFWFICEKAYLGKPQEILKDTWQTLEDDTLRSLYNHG